MSAPMSEHIWIVRNPKGEALGASIRSEHSAVRDAIRYCADDASARLGVDKLEDVMLETWSETATGYEQNGYTLARTPLPPRAEASAEPVACKKCGGTGYTIDSARSVGSAVVGKKCDCGSVAYITNGDPAARAAATAREGA